MGSAPPSDPGKSGFIGCPPHLSSFDGTPFLYQSGGVRLTPPQRSERHLTGGGREEISRGIAAGESARQLARRLGRSPSIVSREIARNGGRHRYRAAPADTAAYARGRRPKQAKLAQRPALRALVEAKPALCCLPSRSQDGCDTSSPVTPPCRSRTKRSASRATPLVGAGRFDRSLTQRLRSARPMRRP
ncbi:helix-turn-helix domain-containing protein (plasmid) [Streptomyces sp. NBC_00984]|uniref:helix-turn-helix domain-containing protein n=1 Tax=Streptomyces sp. NBC_00984 TaxID=2903700 RepID=UPI002F90EDD4|nr:helix-turn-helix domain-containing protein [Streptomyces sp. NBC_00984]